MVSRESRSLRWTSPLERLEYTSWIVEARAGVSLMSLNVIPLGPGDDCVLEVLIALSISLAEISKSSVEKSGRERLSRKWQSLGGECLRAEKMGAHSDRKSTRLNSSH